MQWTVFKCAPVGKLAATWSRLNRMAGHGPAHGKRLLPMLAEQLTQHFGKGFDERNLHHMPAFYQGFPIWDAVRTELSWTHYRLLTRVDNETARQWYMNQAAEQN